MSQSKKFILNSKYEIPFTENFQTLKKSIEKIFDLENCDFCFKLNDRKIKITNSTDFKKFLEKQNNNNNNTISISISNNNNNKDDIYNESEYFYYGDTRNNKINEENYSKKNKNYKELRRINYIKLRKEFQREFEEKNNIKNNENENNNDNDNKEEKNKKRILNNNNVDENDLNNNYEEIKNISHKKKKKSRKERIKW